MSIDAMKQALEALEDVLQWSAEHSEVRAALRAAIEHAERPQTHSDGCWRWHHECAVAKIERAQAQEPVACQYAKDVSMPEYRCAVECQYAQLAQEPRLWQWLTDEEIMEPWPCETRLEFARAIEAKLKEKNK